jgi:hypothetical protein
MSGIDQQETGLVRAYATWITIKTAKYFIVKSALK